MADKIKPIYREIGFQFYCPGCKNSHIVTTVHAEKPCWDFNYDAERPTISPSYLVTTPEMPGRYPAVRCHSYIRDGRIEYLSDCTHDLRGQTVELPDWED